MAKRKTVPRTQKTSQEKDTSRYSDSFLSSGPEVHSLGGEGRGKMNRSNRRGDLQSEIEYQMKVVTNALPERIATLVTYCEETRDYLKSVGVQNVHYVPIEKIFNYISMDDETVNQGVVLEILAGEDTQGTFYRTFMVLQNLKNRNLIIVREKDGKIEALDAVGRRWGTGEITDYLPYEHQFKRGEIWRAGLDAENLRRQILELSKPLGKLIKIKRGFLQTGSDILRWHLESNGVSNFVIMLRNEAGFFLQAPFGIGGLRSEKVPVVSAVLSDNTEFTLLLEISGAQVQGKLRAGYSIRKEQLGKETVLVESGELSA